MPRRNSGKRARRPVRRSPRIRPSIPLLFLTATLPLIAIVIFFGHKYLSDVLRPERSASAASDSEPLPEPQVTATIVETPRIEQVLLDAGVERERLRWDDGVLQVETFDDPEVVTHHVLAGIPGAEARTENGNVIVAHGGIEERLVVIPLQRDTENKGFVPVPSASWSPDPTPTGQKVIVLILDDVGYMNQPIEAVAEIAAKLSFAVIPGSPRATQSANYLFERGFEILCHLPMEPLDYPNVSPGDRAIFTWMSDEEIKTITIESIEAIPHVRGVNNHMGSKATRDRRVMRSVAEVLLDLDVYFVDSRTAGSSVAASVTSANNVPTASRDVFLDDDPEEGAVRRQLRQLARLSEQRDFVVAIGHVYPTTVRVLQEEIPRLQAQGFTFHFPSEVVR